MLITVAKDSIQVVPAKKQCPMVVEDSEGDSVARIRVVLADDHRSVIAKVREILGEEFEIMGTAENGDQGLSSVLSLDADVLVIDISMPILNGLQVAQRLQKTSCRSKIVFLSIHEDPDFILAVFSAGASAYVVKSASILIWYWQSTKLCWETNLFPKLCKDKARPAGCYAGYVEFLFSRFATCRK